MSLKVGMVSTRARRGKVDSGEGDLSVDDLHTGLDVA